MLNCIRLIVLSENDAEHKRLHLVLLEPELRRHRIAQPVVHRILQEVERGQNRSLPLLRALKDHIERMMRRSCFRPSPSWGGGSSGWLLCRFSTISLLSLALIPKPRIRTLYD